MRKQAREICFLLIYEYLFLHEQNPDTKAELLEEHKLEPDAAEFVNTTVDGVVGRYEELKNAIEAKTQNFAYDRIFKTDLALLLLAVYELKHTDTPPAVVIEESLRLAAKYSAEKSKSFLNGILGAIANA